MLEKRLLDTDGDAGKAVTKSEWRSWKGNYWDVNADSIYGTYNFFFKFFLRAVNQGLTCSLERFHQLGQIGGWRYCANSVWLDLQTWITWKL